MQDSILNDARDFLNRLPDAAIRLSIAICALAVGVILIRLGRRIIRHICTRYENRRAEKHASIDGASERNTLKTLVISIFNYLMYFAIALMVLSTLGVDVSSLIAVAGVGGIAISFGCQTLVKDFISGLFLWIEGQARIGDIVTVGGQTGTVENVALRTTTLRGTNGTLYVIPNGDIRTVVNMTRDYRCALVDVTMAHGQDYTAAIKLLQEAMNDLNRKLDMIDETPVVLGVIASDGRAATIRVESKCDISECWALEREIRLTALECWRKNNIKP